PQPLRIESRRPPGAGRIALGAGLSVQHTACLGIAFADPASLGSLLVGVYLGGGHGARGDLDGALHAVAQRVLERIRMGLVHFSLRWLMGSAPARRRAARRGEPGLWNVEERWLKSEVAGGDLRR